MVAPRAFMKDNNLPHGASMRIARRPKNHVLPTAGGKFSMAAGRVKRPWKGQFNLEDHSVLRIFHNLSL